MGFIDNQPVLDLLEKRLGLFSILDEQVVIPGGSDQTFFSKLVNGHRENKLLSVPAGSKLHFCVDHYAGVVTYDGAGFVEKNGDKLLDDQKQAVQSSRDPLVPQLFAAMDAEAEEAANAGGGGGPGGKGRPSGGGPRRERRTRSRWQPEKRGEGLCMRPGFSVHGHANRRLSFSHTPSLSPPTAAPTRSKHTQAR